MLFDEEIVTPGLDEEAFRHACELIRSADVARGSWQDALIWLSRSHPDLKPLFDLAMKIGDRP